MTIRVKMRARPSPSSSTQNSRRQPVSAWSGVKAGIWDSMCRSIGKVSAPGGFLPVVICIAMHPRPRARRCIKTQI
jgi:hypothetical protein